VLDQGDQGHLSGRFIHNARLVALFAQLCKTVHKVHQQEGVQQLRMMTAASSQLNVVDVPPDYF